MRGLATFLAASLMAQGAIQDPKVEATQKKIAALMRELQGILKKFDPDPMADPDPQLEKRAKEIGKEVHELALQASGKDEKKAEQFVLDSLAKFAPEVLDEMRRGNLETLAMSNLKTLAILESTFSTKDSDGNGIKDFWVADVSGLQRIMTGNPAKPIKLLRDDEVALADAKPAVPLDKEGEFKAGDGSKVPFAKLGKASPTNGYLFVAVSSYVDAAGKTINFDSGNGRNKDRFAFCAYPAEYGKPCKATFVVDVLGAILQKDTGGAALTVMPADLAKEGWK